MADRWTDSFLNTLREKGDAVADDALRILLADGEVASATKLFHEMQVNDDIHPADHFPEMENFFAHTEQLPRGIDFDRLQRAEDLFNRNVLLGALILLTKSLPEGYQAPNLSIILNISGLLRTKTFKRLLGTLELVLNVTRAKAFESGGKAVITAQKLRLLHAGVRYMTDKYRPEYRPIYGVPVNMEDLLGTTMGFSYLVIDGMRTLGAGWSADEEEDYLYLWKMYALMMGIHPVGDPTSEEYLPENVSEAEKIYAAYKARHYVTADRNPEGVALARANLHMLREIVPRFFRLFGLGALPAVYMQKLMGDEACARLGLAQHKHPVLSWLVERIDGALKGLDAFGGNVHHHLAERLFQDLIDVTMGGEVTFTIPTSISDMRTMA